MNALPRVPTEGLPADPRNLRILAHRIVGSELPGFLHRTLEVSLGQRAVLLDGGRYVATLPAGRHELEGWRRGAGSTAILVDDGAIPLLLGSEKLFSKDHHRLRVALELGLRVTTPEVFVAQRVGDREQYTLETLQAEVGGELFWLVEEAVQSLRVSDLCDELGKESLRLDLLKSLQPICERSGLLLERLVGLRVEAPDHVAAQRLRIASEQEKASLEGKRALLQKRLDHQRMELDHDIENRRKVAAQKLEERRLWFEQQRVEQTFARQEQMKKLWEMARIHEMQKERRAERLAAHGPFAQRKTPKTHQALDEPPDAEILRTTKTQHGQTAQGRVRPPQWRRCLQHGIKYDAHGGECPLCEREERNRERGARP